jgi:outer membrane protein OmpA-like peptidoglycan-associated protein/tetratricopeptide (TPR) repeat protein
MGDLFSAIYFYEEYLERKPYRYKEMYQLAQLHRQTRNYDAAKELFKKVDKKKGQKFPKARFYYGLMLKSTGEYDKAIHELTQFRRDYDDYKDEREFKKLARNAIEGCDSAKKIVEKPIDVSIDPINNTVNGANVEFSPIHLSDSTFLYASLRVDSLVMFSSENAEEEIPERKFYLAKKKDYDWIGGFEPPLPVNEPGVETGNGAFSKDRKKFYFTKCAKNWQDKMICKLYLTRLKDGQWTEPEPLPEPVNDPNYTTTQPAIGNTSKYNREVIYFVSDRPGGKGGLDLWYTTYNERREKYSTPRNLGYKINTPGNEMSPMFDYMTRRLYYSSDGLPGIGGLDIFYSTGERRKWTEPQNIGYPVSSSYDDLYFTISPKLEDGFFVSNRPNKLKGDENACCDDIYYYRWNNFIRLFVSGTVYPIEKDRYGRKKDYSGFDFFSVPDTIDPLDEAVIALYMIDEENDEKIFIDRDTTNEQGKYVFPLLPDKNYKFEMEGFQYFNEEIHLSTEFITFSDTIGMPPIWVNVLNEKPIVLQDVYYDFNSAELTENAKNVLDTTLFVMLTEAPNFIVEISSHTDSIGSRKSNMELSQERAENVVDYMVSKGIDPKRLIAKGYGATKPVAPNTNPDGSDNPEGRRKNRRTEFRVVGSLLEEEPAEFEDEEY